MRQKAADYCEVDTKTWQGLPTLWQKIVYSSQSDSRPMLKKKLEEEREKKKQEDDNQKVTLREVHKPAVKVGKAKVGSTQTVVDMVRDTITSLLEK